MKLRAGISRWVLLIGPFAVKVPRWGNVRAGLAGNRIEARLSRTHPLYVPVLASLPLGLAVVMPRCEFATLRDYAAVCKLAVGLPGAEPKASNWGHHNGRLVLLDYGHTWVVGQWESMTLKSIVSKSLTPGPMGSFNQRDVDAYRATLKKRTLRTRMQVKRRKAATAAQIEREKIDPEYRAWRRQRIRDWRAVVYGDGLSEADRLRRWVV